MKTKVLLAVAALSYSPLAVAGNEAAYPKENVAAFVVEKLDLTSLPSEFRPKKEKGKKTLADYGFTAQRTDENEAIVEGSRPEILRNLRVCYGTRRKRGRYKGAKRRTAEKEDSEYVAKGARVVSRICCMSGDWWK